MAQVAEMLIEKCEFLGSDLVVDINFCIYAEF